MTASLSNLPGVSVAVSASPPQSSPPTDTGVAFFAGLALAGPIDHAVAVHSMDEFQSTFGARDTASYLYDACDVAFRLGANTIYVGRDAGPAPVNDSVTLKDSGAADSIKVSSLGPTKTGWSAAVTAGTVAGTFILTITDSSNVVVTESPACADLASLLAWAANDAYISVTAVGTNNPAPVAATPLAGGSDDRANIIYTDVATRQAALTKLFPSSLGPGQIAYPGKTNVEIHVALANAAQLTNRIALLDEVDTADASSLVASRSTFLAHASLADLAEIYAAHCADWLIVPGVVPNTARTMPPSPFWAGAIAASDAVTGNQNVPAAGANGVLAYAIARSKADWSDSDRSLLNGHNINVIRAVYGTFRIYGYRSAADPADSESSPWAELSNCRMRMRIVNDLSILGEQYVFSQIDGKGVTVASFTAGINGLMLGYYTLGALYGATPGDAYTVVTAAPVNTAATAAAQQLNAKIGARFSPYAEQVYFGFTKQAITEG